MHCRIAIICVNAVCNNTVHFMVGNSVIIIMHANNKISTIENENSTYVYAAML